MYTLQKDGKTDTDNVFVWSYTLYLSEINNK